MSQGWRQDVRLVDNGEPVDAGTANRPSQDLAARTEYLRDRLDGLEYKAANLDQDAICNADVQVGQPVYFDSVTSQYELAQAGVEVVDGVPRATDASACLGLVVAKKSATICTVCLSGKVALDLTPALTDTLRAGLLYLSSATAGQLVYQEPAASLCVCYADGLGNVFVRTSQRNFLENHSHFSLDLVWTPAGQVTTEEGRWAVAIDDADATLPGWLPADDDVFEGAAPSGAVYGYNLARHPQLQALWPPLPLSGVSLEIYREGLAGGVTASDRLVQFTAAGIWWMDSCPGNTPWPAAYFNSSSSNSSDFSVSLSVGECAPTSPGHRLVLHFLRTNLTGDGTRVERLKVDPASPLTLVSCDTGEPAEVGPLLLGMDFALLVDNNSGTTGSKVIKSLIGNTFQTGQVTEGLVAGSGVTLDGSVRRTSGSTTIHQGLVTVSAELDPAGRELQPTVARLGDAKERAYQDVPYIGFDTGRDSGVRMVFNVPAAGLPSNPKLRLRLAVGGSTSAAAMAALTAAYRILPRGNTAAQTIPTSDTAVDLETDLEITAHQYVEVESDPITIAAGDTVVVHLLRTADDGYAGEMMLLRLAGVIAAS